MKNNPQKGFAMPILIAIVALVVVIGGVSYFATREKSPTKEDAMVKPEDSAMEKGDAMMEKEGDAMMEKDGTMTKEKDFETVIAKAPSITLKDVSKSGATGTAWLAVYNGKTYHRVVAQNMPALPGTDFYEGWLVKNAATGDFFSTGKMKYDASSKEAVLDFVTDGNKSDYRFVVITSEPNDGNPKPDKHIIEERFPTNINLNIVLDAMMEKDGEMMKEEDGAMIKEGGEMISGESMMDQ